MSQKSQVSRIVKVVRNCQSCQKLSRLSEIVKVFRNCQSCQKLSKLSDIFKFVKELSNFSELVIFVNFIKKNQNRNFFLKKLSKFGCVHLVEMGQIQDCKSGSCLKSQEGGGELVSVTNSLPLGPIDWIKILAVLYLGNIDKIHDKMYKILFHSKALLFEKDIGRWWVSSQWTTLSLLPGAIDQIIWFADTFALSTNTEPHQEEKEEKGGKMREKRTREGEECDGQKKVTTTHRSKSIFIWKHLAFGVGQASSKEIG